MLLYIFFKKPTYDKYFIGGNLNGEKQVKTLYSKVYDTSDTSL